MQKRKDVNRAIFILELIALISYEWGELRSTGIISAQEQM
jgi:hypothetical protein